MLSIIYLYLVNGFFSKRNNTCQVQIVTDISSKHVVTKSLQSLRPVSLVLYDLPRKRLSSIISPFLLFSGINTIELYAKYRHRLRKNRTIFL